MLRRMSDALPQAIAVNYRERLVLFEDGSTAPFVAMFDHDGDPTDDADEASSVVVMHDSGWWLALFEGDFEHVMTN
jgi:hypothetical protein